MDEEVVFRPYSANDIAFIYSSWGSSSYKGSNAHKHMSPQEFHALHRPIIEQFFSKPKATIIVANLTDEPEIILGWIAVEILDTKVVIHYCYVKATFRGRRIATSLINRTTDKDKQVVITHLTHRAKTIISNNKAKYSNFVYLPIT